MRATKRADEWWQATLIILGQLWQCEKYFLLTVSDNKNVNMRKYQKPTLSKPQQRRHQQWQQTKMATIISYT